MVNSFVIYNFGRNRMKNLGALPDWMLHDMRDAGFIRGSSQERVSPASLDLCLSEEIYRVNGMFLPRTGETIRSLLSRLDARPHKGGAPFEHEVTYLARLNESLSLQRDVYGYCNPKSSTGRNDVHVRALADGVPSYDTVDPAGFSGDLWAVVVPRAYPVIIEPMEPLNQLRLFNADTRLSKEEVEVMFAKWKPLYTLGGECINFIDAISRDKDGSISLTLDLESSVVGWEYTGQQTILDFSQGKKAYESTDFFRPIAVHNSRVHLRRGGFYILSTAEAVRVPPSFACEMVPVDSRMGEFRAHYAGFIDPGWGYGKDGEGKGRPLTLEVRPFEDLVIMKKQPIAKIKFERMMALPELHYDAKGDSNYCTQDGPKLAKHFK